MEGARLSAPTAVNRRARGAKTVFAVGWRLTATPAARAYLAEKGYDPDNGARPLGRVIQEEIKRALGEELLFGKLEKGGQVTVDAKDGKLVFEMTPRASSEPRDA